MKFFRTNKNNKAEFIEGMKNGIPIGLGYFAVSFSLGIAARNAGLSAFQAFLASFLCTASAGEYAGFTMIAASASYIETAVMTFVVNARYILMSCALGQHLAPKTGLLHRLLIGYDVTDELFGIYVARPGYFNPFYAYGAVLTSTPFWSVGTMLGAIMGNLLPLRLVSALSVSLYGMFIAVIIPPARKDKIIAGLIAVCFAASYASEHIPAIAGISGGTRSILLTVGISAAAAVLFPKNQEGAENE